MEFTQEEIVNLGQVLRKVSFLEHLTLEDIDPFPDELQKRPFKRGEVIIRQGKRGENFYIVSRGTLGVYKKTFFGFSKDRIATLRRDAQAFFGEMALLGNSRRSASVIGEEDGELYFLSRRVFSNILLKSPAIAKLIKQTAAARQAENLAEGSSN